MTTSSKERSTGEEERKLINRETERGNYLKLATAEPESDPAWYPIRSNYYLNGTHYMTDPVHLKQFHMEKFSMWELASNRP